MDVMMTELSDRLATIHRVMAKAIEGLPDEAFDWQPGPEMNSPGVLLAHALGAERYWIGDVAGGEDSKRDREAEFKTAGVGAAAFIAQAEAVLAHSQSVLARLSPADLAAVRTAPLFGQRVTGAWAVLHALEHTALHAGHLEITRQLWDARQGGA